MIKNPPLIYIFIYLLLTAIGLMHSGSVYKAHTFNKETAHKSHESSTVDRTNFHSTIQVHEHYKTAENRKYRRKQDEYTDRRRTRAVKPIARRYYHFVHRYVPRSHMGLNTGLQGQKPVSGRLNYDTDVTDKIRSANFQAACSTGSVAT
jgi:hypothetical protein